MNFAYYSVFLNILNSKSTSIKGRGGGRALNTCPILNFAYYSVFLNILNSKSTSIKGRGGDFLHNNPNKKQAYIAKIMGGGKGRGRATCATIK